MEGLHNHNTESAAAYSKAPVNCQTKRLIIDKLKAGYTVNKTASDLKEMAEGDPKTLGNRAIVADKAFIKQ